MLRSDSSEEHVFPRNPLTLFLGSCWSETNHRTVLTHSTLLLHKHINFIKALSNLNLMETVEFKLFRYNTADILCYIWVMGLFSPLGFLSSFSCFNKLKVMKHFGALKGSLQIRIHERQLEGHKIKHHFCFLTRGNLLLIAFVFSFISFHLFSVHTHHISSASSDFHQRISDSKHVSYLHATECFPSMIDRILVESSRYTEQYVFVSVSHWSTRCVDPGFVFKEQNPHHSENVLSPIH